MSELISHRGVSWLKLIGSGLKVVGVGAAIALLASCSTPDSGKSQISSATLESDAKSSVDSMLFDQQTYFLENDKFAASVGQLKSGLASETKSYTYTFVPRPNQRQGMAIKATPKVPNLRSYTGVAFAVKLGRESMTVTQVCETEAPSTTAPVAPANPSRPSDKIVCPPGSRAAFSVLAQN
jgi:hypothetical protein